MANPVSQIPSAQLPYMDSVCISPGGTPTLLFHRFMTGIWQRTGGAVGVNNSDVQQIASEALTLAHTASSEATAADTLANTALTAANNAQAAATAAAASAAVAQASASSVANTALIRSQNLADLTSVTAARSNLGLSTFPLTFSFDTCPAALSRGIPVTRAMTLPANFAGTYAWWGIPAAVNATFSVGRSRAPSSTITPIGTIILVHGGSGIILSVQAAVSFAAGDALVVTCPGSPDVTLAQVSFTFPMTLV